MTWSNTGWGQLGEISGDDTDSAQPKVTSISPATGTTFGNTSVEFTGVGFKAGARVLFGTTASASVTFNSQIKLTVISPAHSAAVVSVTVINPNGKTSVLAAAYTYA